MTKKLKIPLIQVPQSVFFPNTILPIFIGDRNLANLIKSMAQNTTENQLIAVQMLEARSFVKHSEYCSVGTPVILEENEEGHIKLIVKGLMRVEISNTLQDIPWKIIEAKVVEDQEVTIDLNDKHTENLKNLLLKWLNTYIQNSVERKTFIDSLISIESYMDYICVFLITDLEIKQYLLATSSLTDRIRILKLIFRSEDFIQDFQVINAIKNYQDIELMGLTGH